MNSFQEIKKNARKKLKGQRLKGAVTVLMLCLPGLLAGLTEQAIRAIGQIPAFLEGSFAPANPAIPAIVAAAGCGLLCFLLWAPLSMGAARWYWRGSRGGTEPLGTLFHYFEGLPVYRKAVGMPVQIGLRIGLWYLLFCMPGLLASAVAFWRGYWQGAMALRETVGALGAAGPLFMALIRLWPLLAGALTVLASQRYFLAPWLLAEDSQAPVRRHMRKSVRLMRGWAGRVLLLRLSFWPWYLPGAGAVLCFGAGLTQRGSYLFWAAAGLCLVQFLLNFYGKPVRCAVLAQYAGEILYGQQPLEGADNVTREYFTKSGEMTLPLILPGPLPTSGEPTCQE